MDQNATVTLRGRVLNLKTEKTGYQIVVLSMQMKQNRTNIEIETIVF